MGIEPKTIAFTLRRCTTDIYTQFDLFLTKNKSKSNHGNTSLTVRLTDDTAVLIIFIITNRLLSASPCRGTPRPTGDVTSLTLTFAWFYKDKDKFVYKIYIFYNIGAK